MTLRPEYALGHSLYNDFLFAVVGEEGNGVQLTVLTALTRLGLDPWQEAASLSDLSRDAAARALAVTIAKLPEGGWKAADSGAIAVRLVARLPERSGPSVPVPKDRVRKDAAPEDVTAKAAASAGSLAAGRWMVWGVLAVAVLSLTLYLQPDNNLESAPANRVSTQP
jgi:hypothetical protein